MPSNYRFSIIPAYTKPDDCFGCVLEQDGIGFATAEGSCSLGVLAIGEALGPTEAKEGLPFRPSAPAGSLLERAFRLCGYDRMQFGIFNVVNCLPNSMNGFEMSESVETEAARHCRVHLNKVIEHFQPKCILALGNVPLRSLTPFRGKKQTIDYMRGFALYSAEFKVPVVPSYHPSFIQRGAFNLLPVLCRDIKYAVQVARDGFRPSKVKYYPGGRREAQYLVEERCKPHPELVISVDFETAGNTQAFEDEQLIALLGDEYDGKGSEPELGTDQEITQVNISIAEEEAYVFNFAPDVREPMTELLALPNPKVGHNLFAFDQQVAIYNNIPMSGESHDSMLCFHHLYPDIPGRSTKTEDALDGTFANLQYCASFYGFDRPWKHLVDENPELYGACDSDATLRLFNRVRCDLMKLRYGKDGLTLWDGYCNLVKDLWPILKGASNRGIPVSKEKMAEFYKSISIRQRELSARIQAVVPEELMPSKQKNGLTKQPKDVENYVERQFKLPSEIKRCKCFKIRKGSLQDWYKLGARPVIGEDGKLRAADPSCELCGGKGSIELPDRVETRWCKLDEFNPNSPVQMKAYAIYKHHTIPKNKDGRYAMDKWALDQLARATHDPLYRSTIEYRQFEKMKSYALQWMPAKDGRAHPEFSFYPATGQLSSYNPNAQNLPSLSKYVHAADFRDGIEAPPGYRIVELDLKSFHAQTLGFEAGCRDYIRLAKLDIHSYVAGTMLKLPYFDQCLEWEDGALLDFLKWHRKNYVTSDGTTFQKIRDERAKVGVLAFGLGQGANSLFTSNRDSFVPDWYTSKRDRSEQLYAVDHKRADSEGLAEAQKVHDALNERFPKVKKYRDTMPLIAQQNGNRLISRYGCIRWFWDIRHYDARNKKYVAGGDWDKVIAFPVQNDGHGYLKYALLRLEATRVEKESAGASEMGSDGTESLLDRYGFINTVHDSVVFCCPENLVDECVVNVKAELERPSEVLTFDDGSGLSVECEAKQGRTWGAMEELKV